MKSDSAKNCYPPANKISLLLLCAFMLSVPFTLSSQTTDTSKTKKHSPQTAALMSACLPGLGQVYNRKYRKVPVVYAGVGLVSYFIISNSKNLKLYNTAYKARIDNDPATTDGYPKYSDESLKQRRDFYRRNTELSVIAATAVYLLNILDATVDAHLFDFDIDDNLSMKIKPGIYTKPDYSVTGLTLSFTFGKNTK